MQKKIILSDYGIPKTVKVGGFVYKVIFPYSFDEESAYVGLHQCDDLIIKLGMKSPSHQSCMMPPQKVHEAFLHEVFHAIDYFYSNNIMEEAEIDLLAIAWHTIMVDNDISIHKNIESIPKKIKIFNILYEVEDHKFVDIEERSSSSNNIGKIQLPYRSSRDEQIHPLVRKCTLITLINFIIDNTFDMRFLRSKSEELENLFSSFSNGLFQVLRENDIEGMVKNG